MASSSDLHGQYEKGLMKGALREQEDAVTFVQTAVPDRKGTVLVTGLNVAFNGFSRCRAPSRRGSRGPGSHRQAARGDSPAPGDSWLNQPVATRKPLPACRRTERARGPRGRLFPSPPVHPG